MAASLSRAISMPAGSWIMFVRIVGVLNAPVMFTVPDL